MISVFQNPTGYGKMCYKRPGNPAEVYIGITDWMVLDINHSSNLQ